MKTLLTGLKYFGLFLLSVFILLNIIAGCMGLTSIILTAIFYAFIGILGILILNYTTQNTERRKNLKVFIITLVLSLFIAELSFQYLFQADALQKGDFGFIGFPYGSPGIEILLKKYLLHAKDLRLINVRSDTVDLVGGSEFSYRHHYNSLGFRGNEFSESPSKINLLALGDSYTEGNGAPGDSTWPHLLEIKLNRKLCSDRIQCINGGVMGSNPFTEFMLLDKVLLRYHPKVVLVAINNTDITDVIRQGGWERFSKDNEPVCRPRPWWFFLYQCSAIVRFAMHHNRNWLLLNSPLVI